MDTFIDLYWDVAESLSSHGHYTEALYFYTAINDREQVLIPHLRLCLPPFTPSFVGFRDVLTIVQWTYGVGGDGPMLCRVE